ncbi:hypothetical protein NP233_g12916 [Leucocoprinus birnbaumii]|uniref:Ubiquitin-like protease family profile domain-containing protein n=1 Tax=Leucocoprinus birnbaumii TaxID=56174 RepID=A0AAD5VJ90_9AGAR|nr:hypothetical protein NP233_g12916 [Leucocoprinus birnbaumii]
MGSCLDLDEVTDPSVHFSPLNWIGHGKKYNSTLPSIVHEAKNQAIKIPREYQQFIMPPPEMSVIEFTSLAFPKQSYAQAQVQAASWFSSAEPDGASTVLKTHDIPPRVVLRELTTQLPQAWLDGARSISNHQFNDGKDHLPLWAVPFWSLASGMVEQQKKWCLSIAWVEQMARGNGGMELRDMAQRALEIFEVMGWNRRLQYQRGAISAFCCTLLLRDEWLTDEIFSIFEEEVQKSGLRDRTIVLNSYFTQCLEQCMEHAIDFKRPNLLTTIASRINEEQPIQLFFPMHVHGNHWVARYIDMEKRTIGYSESLTFMPKPTSALKAIALWLEAEGKGVFSIISESSLECAAQEDTFNCSMFTITTIQSHALRETPTWRKYEREEISVHRMSIFHAIAKTLFDSPPHPKPNPTLSPPLLPNTLNHGAMKGELNKEGWITIGAISAEDPINQSGASHLPVVNKLQKSFSMGYLAADKKRRKGGDSGDEDPLRTPPKKSRFIPAGQGTSKSAVNARKRIEAYRSGEWVPSDKEIDAWIQSIKGVDSNVVLNWNDVMHVYHQVCKRWVSVSEPLVVYHFKDHCLTKCPALKKENAQTQVVKGARKLETYFSLKHPAKKPAASSTPHLPQHDPSLPIPTVPHTTSNSSSAPKAPPLELRSKKTAAALRPKLLHSGPGLTVSPHLDSNAAEWVPCVGLSEKASPRVANLFQCVGGTGGGGQDKRDIAKAKYGHLFGQLTEEQKSHVRDIQEASRRWTYDHSRKRVYSTACEKSILTFGDKPAMFPKNENLKHNNKEFRDGAVGQLFIKVIGLQEIVKNSDHPFVRYARGALNDEYDDKIFGSLVKVLVQIHDREKRQVGLQNFKYTPHWDEFCQIIQMRSTQAYEFLRSCLPGRTVCLMQVKNARKTRFPLTMSDEVFTQAKDHLNSLDYDGPVGLACDDTALLSTFRLYWSSKDQVHYLIGGIDGPLPVLNPEELEDILEKHHNKKGTKMRLWAMTLMRPHTTPIIVAARPIHQENVK